MPNFYCEMLLSDSLGHLLILIHFLLMNIILFLQHYADIIPTFIRGNTKLL